MRDVSVCARQQQKRRDHKANRYNLPRHRRRSRRFQGVALNATPQNLVFLREQNGFKLFGSIEGKLYVFFEMPEGKEHFLGQKISWLKCWHDADLCNQHLERPHFTCPLCPLRRVASGELDAFVEIEISQIWSLPKKRPLSRKIFKNVVSLVESLGWLT